jgi:hypothetical protein
MPRKLIPLEEYNAEQLSSHDRWLRKQEDPKTYARNGLECPKCGAELYDSRPGVKLLSNPPQKNIACTECDYTGLAYS